MFRVQHDPNIVHRSGHQKRLSVGDITRGVCNKTVQQPVPRIGEWAVSRQLNVAPGRGQRLPPGPHHDRPVAIGGIPEKRQETYITVNIRDTINNSPYHCETHM